MLRRLICAFLLLAVCAGIWYVAKSTDDPDYSINEHAFSGEEKAEEGSSAKNSAEEAADTGNLTLWYTDETLTDYLTSCALSYEQDTGIKVNIVPKDGVQFLEAINAVSVKEPQDREETMPDLYIASHDDLQRAYLSGLAAIITDPDGIVLPSIYPETALNAMTCYDHYVGYPLYYETNFFLYNKTYMASIAHNRIEADEDLAEGEAATRELEENGVPEEDTVSSSDGDDETDQTDGQDDTDNAKDEYTEEENPMGEEDETADPAVLEKLATMIPATMEDVKTFANNYDAPEAVESVFKWDVSDIFYNYFFVGNYMDVGGEHGDNASVFNIYNSQAVECLRAYQGMNQFFSIDTKVDDYNNILQDFIDGKMVFTVATTDAIARIHEAARNGEFEFEYGISTLPDVTDLLKARGLSVTDAVVINGYSEKQNDANLFATYLVYKKASDLYMHSGKVSCCKTVEFEDPEMARIMDEYEKSMPLPKMVETSNFWVQLEIAFTEVWNGGDPDEILRNLSDTIGAQIEQIKANLPTQESFSAGAGGFVK